MTNSEAYNFYSALQELQKNKNSFPAKIAYAIIRNSHLLEDIVKSMNAARDEMVRTYCEPLPDDSGRYKVKEEYLEKFQKEFNDLYAVENEVSLQKISLSDLDGISLSLDDMNALYPMISEEA